MHIHILLVYSCCFGKIIFPSSSQSINHSINHSIIYSLFVCLFIYLFIHLFIHSSKQSTHDQPSSNHADLAVRRRVKWSHAVIPTPAIPTPVVPTPAKDTFSFFSAIYRVRARVRVSRVSRVSRVGRVSRV